MTDAARTTVNITVNGIAVEAKPGEILIEAAERAGTYVPRFCYHPRMEPVGMCRMCLVEVDGPRGATLQPACYLRVNEGMNVTTDSDKVKKAQDGVLEFLLANHPLDCPVCDKGGECPLQDQTLAHGSGETRFIEEKRHFVKPVDIGELVLLDRERCIQCARCTRFSAEVAGDTEIAFAGRGDLIEVAPSPSKPFDSVFSGNTVQICPVGALTAKPYRFLARPWDLEQVESTCTTCSVGCRVAVQSSGDRLTRVLGIDSEPVNHGWLCDKGRFTLDSIDGNEEATDLSNAATRVTQPHVRVDGQLVAVSWGEALAAAAALLSGAAASPNGVGAIGGAALTNEGAFAWERFVRGVLGSDHLDAQYGDGLDAALLQALPAATIDEAAHANTIVTLGGDLRQELPVLFLRLREALVKGRSKLVSITQTANPFGELTTVELTVRPGESARVAQAIADPGVSLGLDALIDEFALGEARTLFGSDGAGVVVVVGRANLAESAEVTERALRVLAERYPAARFLVALRRGNVRGALDMGLSPSLRPGRAYVADEGRDALAQIDALRSGKQRAVLLLGGCLLGNVLDDEAARDALERADVVAVTGHGGKTLDYADVVLPALVQHERVGTVTNLEGRVSALAPKIAVPGSAWPDVAIAAELAEHCGQHLGLTSIEQTAGVIEESTGYPCASVLTSGVGDGQLVGHAASTTARRPLDPVAFPGIHSVATVGLADYAGETVQDRVPHRGSTTSVTLDEVRSGRELNVPRRDSYAFALVVARRLYDRGIAMQGSPALSGLVASASLSLAAKDMDRLGVGEGEMVNLVGARGTMTLAVTASNTARGTAQVIFTARNEDGATQSWHALVEPGEPVSEVRVETR